MISNRLKDYLKQIEETDAKYGAQPQRPISAEHVERLKFQAKKFNGYMVDPTYTELLQQVNGVDFNGYVLYGSYATEIVEADRKVAFMDFVFANTLWSEYGDNEDHELIMYAESGLSLYVHDRRVNRYQVIDRAGGDAYFESEGFEGLAEQLFKDMLGIDND